MKRREWPYWFRSRYGVAHYGNLWEKDRNSPAARPRRPTSRRWVTCHKKKSRVKPPLLYPSQQPPRRTWVLFGICHPNSYWKPEGLDGNEEGNAWGPKPDDVEHAGDEQPPRRQCGVALPRRRHKTTPLCSCPSVASWPTNAAHAAPSAMGGPPPSPAAATPTHILCRYDHDVRGDTSMNQRAPHGGEASTWENRPAATIDRRALTAASSGGSGGDERGGSGGGGS